MTEVEMKQRTINIQIDAQGTFAIYEQIVNQLKSAIVTGALSPGEALPSIRFLASQLEVSVITTKRAYGILEEEGLIRSVAGKGFYVCEYNTDYLKEKQIMMLEKRFLELISDCKKVGLSKENVMELVETLYIEQGEGESNGS